MKQLERMNEKAKTLELYYTRYPKHDMTPGFLYTAGLTYEKQKDWANAVRIYTLVVKDYPKHQYAPEAAFSIPIIEEKQGNKDKMATTYESFAAQYPNDKSKGRQSLSACRHILRHHQEYEEG